MQARPYSDEQLSAWVDGECSPAERAEIAAWLRTQPEDAARVQAWAADREALRAAYAAVADEPVPQRLADAVWQSEAGLPQARAGRAPRLGEGAGAAPRMNPGGALGPDEADGAHGIHGAGSSGGSSRAARAAWPAWPVWGLAAAAAMLFVLGAASGGLLAWQWQERQATAQGRGATTATGTLAGASQGWLQRAAFAHSVYTPEPRHAVEVKAQEEHLSRWLTRRIEAPVKLFNLRELGFELVGGRLLPDGPGKSAQLMYQDAGGKRVTVYLRKPEPGTDTAFRYEQRGTLGMFYWVEEKTGFALVGDLPKEQLLAMARSIYEQDATLPAPSLTPPGAASAQAASSAASPSPGATAASAPAK